MEIIGRGLKSKLWAGLVGAGLAVTGGVSVSAAQRIRPPDNVPCPRDHLTAFTGSILHYRRESGRTEIRMRTDEETTETFVLRHSGSDDPSKWFLLKAGPFKKEDWGAIESEKGRLRPKMRATVWVCDDRSNPIVDWRPPE